MALLAIVAALFFLKIAKTRLLPVALAVFISYALNPVVAWLGRHRLSRAAVWW